jgi:hypothetical protein
MKTYGSVGGCIHSRFLDLGTNWMWVVSFTLRPVYSGRSPGTHWIGSWVGPKAGLDAVEKRKFLTLPELQLRPLSRPSRSQSLYRLRYRGYFCSSITADEGFTLLNLFFHLCLILNIYFPIFLCFPYISIVQIYRMLHGKIRTQIVTQQSLLSIYMDMS